MPESLAENLQIQFGQRIVGADFEHLIRPHHLETLARPDHRLRARQPERIEHFVRHVCRIHRLRPGIARIIHSKGTRVERSENESRAKALHHARDSGCRRQPVDPGAASTR